MIFSGSTVQETREEFEFFICFGDEAVDSDLGKLQGLFFRKAPSILERDVSHFVFLRIKVVKTESKACLFKDRLMPGN